MAQITVELDSGTFIEPSRLTVGEWLDMWLADYVKISVKLTTYQTYERKCRGNIKPHLAAVKLSALTAPAIQKMINRLNEDLSPKSVKCIHGILHKALQQAVSLGYIRANPADACKLPKLVKKEITPLDKEEISAFIDAVRGHEFETLYLVTLFTGVRQSEAIGLRWRCVDFETGRILINGQLLRDYAAGGYYFDESTKNNKSRHIAPAKFVMAALKKHKVEQMKARMLAGSAWIESDYVFTNESGEHLKHVTVYKGYKRIVSELGIPTARYHDLRHSYAVAAIRAGDDVKTVQENLGHHTAAFTLDQYGHVTENMKRESADRMDMYIANALAP